MNGDTLTASVAVAAPSSSYDFALHRGVIGNWSGYATAFNQIFVYGTGTDLAEAFAYTPGSPARPLRLADRFLTTLALVQARASAELIVQKEKRRVGELVALPHFGAERGDVVTADGENWRIVEIAEKYRKPHGMAQTLTLRGTT